MWNRNFYSIISFAILIQTSRITECKTDYDGHAVVKVYIDQLTNLSTPVRTYPEHHVTSDTSSIALPSQLNMMWEGSDQDGRRFVVAHIEPKHHERFKRDTGFRWLSNDLRNWISRTQSRWNSLRNANQDFRSLDSPQALPQTMYSSSLPLPGSEFGEGDEDRFHDYDGLPNIHNGSHGLMDNPRSNGYSNLVSNFRLDVYHPIDEIYAYFDSVARHPRYGHTVFVKTIGYSHERRPIRSVEVQQDPPNVGKKLVYMDALVHAREWITGASLLHMFEHILVHRVPCNFIFVPVVNPDGYSYTWTNDRLWRKNRRAPSARSSSSRLRPLAMLRNEKCVGVDLNRNFDINFAGEGASSNICSQLYAGDRPFSEPETAALARLVADRRKEIRLLISLHSFNQLWSSPYAYTLYPSPHAELHRKVLKEVQSAVFSVNQVKYNVGALGQSLYVGSGFLIDWAYSTLAIVHSYLIELRDKGDYGFLLPEDQIQPVAEEVMAGLRVSIRHAYH